MDQKDYHDETGVDGLRTHTLMQQGAEHYKARRYYEAFNAYEEAIQLDSNNASAFVSKGDCLRQLGNHRLAALAYEQAIALDPNNSSAFAGNAYILVELKEYTRATFAYQEAIRLDPANASAYNVKGLVLYAQKRFYEALLAFEEAIRLAMEDNNIAGFYNNQGKALHELKRDQAAIEAFLQALRIKPGYDKYLENMHGISKFKRFKAANQFCDRADALISQHRYDEALQCFKKAQQVDDLHIRADISQGYLLITCHRYEEALALFDHHLHLYPWRTQALMGKGKTLYYLRRYNDALRVFQEVLRLDDQIAQVFVDIGHVYFAQNRLTKALKYYEAAIELLAEDATCYINASSILLSLKNFQKVILTYNSAFRCIPGFLSIYTKLQSPSLKLILFWPYLVACKEVIEQGTPDLTTHYTVRDTLSAFGHCEDAARVHEKALTLVLSNVIQDIDQLWSLMCHPLTKSISNHTLLESLRIYITLSATKQQRMDAFQLINPLFQELFDDTKIPVEHIQSNLQWLVVTLRDVFEGEQAEAVTIIANYDDFRIAQLLILLAPFALPDLEALAHQVTLRWVVAPRDDDLVIRFYHVLECYHVPFEDADWLFAQELMLEDLFIQAKSVLSDLVENSPTPERLWLLAEAMWQRHDPAQEQIVVLRRYIDTMESTKVKCKEAFIRIGELHLGEQAFQSAIKAFEDAECYCATGETIPQLDLYRDGNWEAFPGSSQHPDYAFPTVVVIDLECDYQPDAADGSRVFEIAAVRYKGRTELASCNPVIQRDFPSKVSHRQNEAIEPEKARCLLQKFIRSSIVVGHNLQGFDIKHLRGMNVEIDDALIIDTLVFARLLYPDSVQHHLALLCDVHGIQPRGEWHTALADAGACADLLYALGEELVRRGEPVLAGFQALVPPTSAFARAVLQPRGVLSSGGTASDVGQKLDPSPAIAHILTSVQQKSASPGMIAALEQQIDALVERHDSSGAYIRHLPLQQRSVVVVNSRIRLERILAQSKGTIQAYVLPDPHTLLCPQRLQQSIEHAQSWQMRLALFCLYQASHNHDARTLYPLRIASDDPSLNELKQILLSSCCASDWQHLDTCPATLATQAAIKNHSLLLATHESFLRQSERPKADVIVVDDADTLQMHFAEYLAERVTSEQVRTWSPSVFDLIDAHVMRLVKAHLGNPGLYERIPLQNVIPYLTQPQDSDERSLLAMLRSAGPIGAAMATMLEKLCQRALKEDGNSGELRASWLEFKTARQADSGIWRIEQWSFCGLDRHVQQAFQEYFWQPYKRHLICGTTITLGALKTRFLTRFFGIPETITFVADQCPVTLIHIPSRDELRPASFLGRRSWARSIGSFLHRLAATPQRSFLVSIQAAPIAHALAQAFKEQMPTGASRQVLSPQLGWTTTKMADRLADETRLTLTFISPGLRESVLDGPVDVEATGPLRFLNQQDPLVAAQLRLYARRYPNENPFSSYLLPQALLELKTRISSPAKIHIILDSGLNSKVYYEEVRSLFPQECWLDTLPGLADEKPSVPPEAFTSALDTALERWGLSSRTRVEDETLHLALRTYWELGSFREAPLNQKEILQAIFDGNDQLVIAATGGGKSLCYQLPAVLMAQEIVPKVTLVVSPLIALMQDQIETLKNMGIFSAIAWNSTLKPVQRQNYLEGIKRGWYSIIYIAPEQIHSASLGKALAMREVGLIAIDEAHCVSQWGHNFRTAYIALKRWIETQIYDGQQRPFPIIALTATARKGYCDAATGTMEEGTVEEIIKNLDLRLHRSDVKAASIERPELEYCVEQIALPCSHCQFPLPMSVGLVKCLSCGRWSLVEEEQIKQAKVQGLISLLADRDGQGLRQRWDRALGHRQRGLIYCAYTATTDDLADILRADPRLAGLRIAAYHGKKSDAVKEHVYNSFIRDDQDGVDIVVATNAFGMGIDVRRLGFIIHFDIPGTLEAYIQEAGRAGRDLEFKQEGEAARCILLYHEHDLEKPRSLDEMNNIEQLDIDNIYESLRKVRKRNEHEIFIAEHDLSVLSGINKDKVGTVLYYLEHHTCAYGNPVLERGENVQTAWLLAFEHGYEERIRTLVPGTSSRQLADAFRCSDEHRLREREIRMINGDELADSLGWETWALLREISQLLNRHVLVHGNQIFIQWSKCKSEADQGLTQLEQDIGTLLRAIPNQQALQSGKRVSIDVESLYAEVKRATIPLPTFTRFLDGLSKNTAVPLRLFKFFERALSGSYQLELVADQSASSTIEHIFQQLRLIIHRYAPGTRSDSYPWQVLDMLSEEKNYEQRQALEQGILLLATLEFLSQQSPDRQKSPMRIRFKQDDVPSDVLDIDLSRLRLVKRQSERKLELMKAYATLAPEQRTRMLNAYFAGDMPLLETFEMRPELTGQQQSIVATEKGYHLVNGPAGSGKTTVLEEHVRFLLENLLIPPEHVLVVTHYNSAVSRISKNVSVSQVSDRIISARTLNKLGMSIFMQNRELLLRPDCTPYYAEKVELRLLKSEQDERPFVLKVLSEMREELDLSLTQESPLKERQYVVWSRANATMVDNCQKDITRLRQHGIFPTRTIDSAALSYALSNRDNQNWIFFVYDVYCRHVLLLSERGCYTYDDQILFALALLKANPEIAKPIQRRYEQIIIDEFQDLTPAQLELISILSQRHHSVMAFGDDAQDIRVKQDHSRVPSQLEKRFHRIIGNALPLVHHLQTNFRSVQEILDVAGIIRNDVSQIAARGYRGEKPAVIRVKTNVQPTSLSSGSNVVSVLQTMVKLALDRVKNLPGDDKGSVALMVAISGRSQKLDWSQIVQDYLKKQQEPFSVLDHSIYQTLHIERILTYFRLIVNDHLDTALEELLRSTSVPCLSLWQLNALREVARKNEESLLNTLKHREILNYINVSQEQEEALRRHLSIIYKYSPANLFADVWQAISELQDSPLAQETLDEQQKGELDSVLNDFKDFTVLKAIEHVNSHISFLEEHHTNQQLVVTSIDSAKSQAFDTVFLLGAQALKINFPNNRARLYVSLSRARQRFFFLIDEQSDLAQGDDSLLPWLQKELNDNLLWLEAAELS